MKRSEIIATLRLLGIKPSRLKGQNFLIDDNILKKQVGLAEIKGNEIVLEIGSGLGILTQKLAGKARKVIAVENDQKLADFLKNSLPDNVELIVGDALKIEFPRFDKVVSNLPYQISSPLTFKLLNCNFKFGVLMYQKEFAERMIARKGSKEYSRLSVNVYYKAECELVQVVSKDCFYPIPKIDSAMVMLEPREAPFHVKSEPFFFKVVETLFKHRRKKIKNSLLSSWSSLSDSKEDFESLLETLEWKDKRVEELSPEEIGELSNVLYESLKR